MPPDDICKHCRLPPFPGCVNMTVILDKDENSKECPRYRARRTYEGALERLTPEMREIVPVKASPLFVPKKAGEAKASVDLTRENVFVHGVWKDFLSHLRFILMFRSMSYKIVDDSRLRDVYTGSESYKSLPESARERREINNALSDLVSEKYDLVIIRLGILSHHKTDAPANILKEALLIRVESLNKPVWLFESRDPGIPWNHSKSGDVQLFVESRFRTVWLDGTVTDDEAPDISVEDGSEDGAEEYLERQPEEAEDVPVHVSKPEPVEESTDASDLDSLLGGGEPKRKKSKWRGR